MSKQAEAELILKLYELRREATMRQARDWFSMEFFPQSVNDVKQAMFGPNSAYLRMVMSYWDMAAALVHHDAIGMDFFNDTNGEYFVVFSRLEPILEDLRAAFGPQFMSHLERLVDATPGGREKSAATRERMNAVRAEVMAAHQGKTSGQS